MKTYKILFFSLKFIFTLKRQILTITQRTKKNLIFKLTLSISANNNKNKENLMNEFSFHNNKNFLLIYLYIFIMFIQNLSFFFVHIFQHEM